jgi:hypothetical protein
MAELKEGDIGQQQQQRRWKASKRPTTGIISSGERLGSVGE